MGHFNPCNELDHCLLVSRVCKYVEDTALSLEFPKRCLYMVAIRFCSFSNPASLPIFQRVIFKDIYAMKLIKRPIISSCMKFSLETTPSLLSSSNSLLCMMSSRIERKRTSRSENASEVVSVRIWSFVCTSPTTVSTNHCPIPTLRDISALGTRFAVTYTLVKGHHAGIQPLQIARYPTWVIDTAPRA